jgi:hypothetical protein
MVADSQIILSMNSLAAITMAACTDAPLALVVYNIGGCYFLDEPIHHEFHDWAPLFSRSGLVIDQSSADNITKLHLIAANACDASREAQWFGALKGELITSERSQERWYRETEQLLQQPNENFTRSFVCHFSDLTICVGSNSLLCQLGNRKPAFLRYSKDGENPAWLMESMLCKVEHALVVSTNQSAISQFEYVKLGKRAPPGFKLVFDLFRFLKSNATERGCHLIHKRSKAAEIQWRSVAESDLDLLGLGNSFRLRVSIIETRIGFRQTLSTSRGIVENGRRLLNEAATFSDPLNAALCLERVGDSFVLPILLMDRTTSLIAVTKKDAYEKLISAADFDAAIDHYRRSLSLSENGVLTASLHAKIATALFAKAVLLGGAAGDEVCREVLGQPFLTHDFSLHVSTWRVDNALCTGSDQAWFLAHSLLRMCQSEEEVVEGKRKLGIATNSEGQQNLEVHRFTRASERFKAAMSIFADIGDDEHRAESEANMAHIERRLAHMDCEAHPDQFTVEEERRLVTAARYYLCARDRVKNPSALRVRLSIDVASVYCQMLRRYTCAPPVDRLTPEQLVEEAERCGREAEESLASIGKTGAYEVLSQTEAVNSWAGKFIVRVHLQFVKDPQARGKLAAKAAARLARARQFFIADYYPADFVDLTLAISMLRLNCGDAHEACKVLVECIRAFRPTSVAIRQKYASAQAIESQKKSREALALTRKDAVEVARVVLKELLRIKLVSKGQFDLEKRLYQMANEATPENVADLLLEVKRSLKL